MVKCRRNVNFEVYQTKYYYGSVKKSKFSFNRHLQFGNKSINNVKEDQGEKLIQTLLFRKMLSADEVLRRWNGAYT